MARQRDGERLVEARKALDGIWNKCNLTGFVGRCWGRKYHSPTPGSIIVLCDGFEVVILHEEGANGPIRVKSFGLPRGESLKDEVIEALKRADLIE